MKYNNIGKFLENVLGSTEFTLYSPKELEKMITQKQTNCGTRIVKTSAGLWVKL